MRTTLGAEQVQALTDRVEAAQTGARAMPKLTEDFPGMTLGDGYAVQIALRDRWVAQGRRQVGWKAGLTSQAKMDQMGVRVPTVGFLLADMARPEGSAVRTDDMVHPRVELELAFVTKADLAGPDVTREQVLAATDFVLPAIEVIDSRYTGFKFDLQSVVADNSSSARYVVGGRPSRPEDLELDTLGVVLEKNGEPLAIAATAAVMGHPADAVALVVKVLHELGQTLPAGSFVMSGGITEAFAVKPGDVVAARFQSLGSVGVRFV
ncbi:2-oxo-3-hexenedioate decarboxylase [Ideonella livida]|uniref:2-oxo-3-hexenedioate decarboxylase n=1 Tax=Ideonella livida TaxID=2707176 RepID=A0A7C9PKG0_9BURK|nr:2-oxo-3-hexenedioate decarboxylase [Ideonella livida]